MVVLYIFGISLALVILYKFLDKKFIIVRPRTEFNRNNSYKIAKKLLIQELNRSGNSFCIITNKANFKIYNDPAIKKKMRKTFKKIIDKGGSVKIITGPELSRDADEIDFVHIIDEMKNKKLAEVIKADAPPEQHMRVSDNIVYLEHPHEDDVEDRTFDRYMYHAGVLIKYKKFFEDARKSISAN